MNNEEYGQMSFPVFDTTDERFVYTPNPAPDRWEREEYSLAANYLKKRKNPFEKCACGRLWNLIAEERLAAIFSRYFSSESACKFRHPKDKENYIYRKIDINPEILNFFRFYRTTPARWAEFPTEFRLKNIHDDNPYKLKNLPIDPEEMKELSIFVICKLIKADEQDVRKYVESIEEEYKKIPREDLSFFEAKTLEELEGIKNSKADILEKIAEEFTASDYGYSRSFSGLDDLKEAEEQYNRAEAVYNLKNKQTRFADLKFREDLTEKRFDQITEYITSKEK